MYFNIFNEFDILNYKPSNNVILIRILEPLSKFNFDVNYNLYSDVLELYIKDTIDSNNIGDNDFSFIHSKMLFDFIIKNNVCNEININCSLGLSRSLTIMICIAKIIYNSELENIISNNYQHYNKYIVDTFMKSNFASTALKKC